MKKLKMSRGVSFTFEEGCNKYLENCRQRHFAKNQQWGANDTGEGMGAYDCVLKFYL